MTNLILKKCSIKTFNDCSFPMIVATVIDTDHNNILEVVEWIDESTNHVDRENSNIEENEQIDFSLVSLKEMLDFLDIVIDSYSYQQEKINHLDKMLKFFGKIKIFMR